VVAFDNYRGEAGLELSIASDNPRWATRQTIATLLMYPFGQLNCRRVTAFVLKGNKRSRRFVEGIGFKLEGKLRDAGKNNEPMLVFGLTKRDFVARYIKERLPSEVNASRLHPRPQIPTAS
jgi:L-amino acid N-acyltransferase YncA